MPGRWLDFIVGGVVGAGIGSFVGALVMLGETLYAGLLLLGLGQLLTLLLVADLADRAAEK